MNKHGLIQERTKNASPIMLIIWVDFMSNFGFKNQILDLNCVY